MTKIIIWGKASNKCYKELNILLEDQQLTLMEFLHRSSVPIASSCLGEGLCKKCIVNDSLLSCQVTLKELIVQKILTINVNYL